MAGLTQCHGMEDLGLVPSRVADKSLLEALNHMKVPVWIAAEVAANSHFMAGFQLVILKGPTRCLEQ